MKKLLILLLLLSILSVSSLESFAQTDSSVTEDTPDNKLNDFLNDIKTSLGNLRKQKDKKSRIAYKDLRLINKEIIKALNTVPPAKCLDALDHGMQDLYALVSELNVGISCGPVIIPPFLPGTSSRGVTITPDCGLPPEMRAIPFNSAFSVVNPLYEDARDIFRTDINENEMPDVCEGELDS